MRHHLSIDIETKSSIDIQKAGLYKYAQSPDFEVLLFAYQWDEDPVELVDLTEGEEIPEWVLDELVNPETWKHAYNAAFEWYCLNRAGYETPLEQWRCTMMHGLYCGYTGILTALTRARRRLSGFKCGTKKGFISMYLPMTERLMKMIQSK